MLKKVITHRNAYLLGLAGFLFSLTVSEYAISVSQFFLAANWLLSRNFKEKWIRIKNSRVLWLVWAFYLLHVIGLLYSADLSYGLDDLRIKLPFLLIPLFIASEVPLTRKELVGLAYFFIGGVTVSTGFAYANYIEIKSMPTVDIREVSPFISHIRLSLMIDLAIVGLAYIGLKKDTFWAGRLVSLAFIIWLIYALSFMQAMTGLIILPIAIIAAFLFTKRNDYIVPQLKTTLIVLSVLLIGLGAYYTNQIILPFLHTENLTREDVPHLTANGNLYMHQFENEQLENGNRVWLNICDVEAKNAWEQLSKIPFDGAASNGGSIRATLYRFLTSKDIPKDSIGVFSLSAKEIAAIESGATNYKFMNQQSIEHRLYTIVWELYNYSHQAGSNEGHSLTQRFEFWKTGWAAIQNASWIGVGTGDLWIAMRKQYQLLNSNLNTDHRLKPHNQFLTTWLALGIPGILLLILVFVYPFKAARYHPVSMAFLIIAFASCLTEDTIEAQVGVSFFIIFYSLFFMHKCKHPQDSPH